MSSLTEEAQKEVPKVWLHLGTEITFLFDCTPGAIRTNTLKYTYKSKKSTLTIDIADVLQLVLQVIALFMK